ncbi:MAG TPA: DUF192 domain-containing protein [Solirubrobacteraceae bacterium]|jgi:hypothetical protein|nr:DUF192 domain-containing protein [Solirubrobacteraceae bacterium]
MSRHNGSTRAAKRSSIADRRLRDVARTKLIVNVTRKECLCVGVVADSPLRRMRGLIGSESLAAGEGLLITPAPAIHTAFMGYAIDVLFLDRDLCVIEIVENLRPWRLASKRGAHSVLELAAGECARRGVSVGDRLVLRKREQRLSAAPDASSPPPPPRSPDSIIWPVQFGHGSEPARLAPMRVLVISNDRHFRSVSSMLLAHRGCVVTTTADRANLAERISREGADVVVVDAEQCLDGPAQAFAAVEGLARAVGVVVVDEAATQLHASPVAKWGPFEDLFAAIERADASHGSWGATA